VEISSGVFKKKFGGRVDQIVENLKFSEKNQAFYIGWFFLLYVRVIRMSDLMCGKFNFSVNSINLGWLVDKFIQLTKFDEWIWKTKIEDKIKAKL
jgi:hypothetical protein